MKLTRLFSFKQKHLQPLWRFHQNVNLCKSRWGSSQCKLLSRHCLYKGLPRSSKRKKHINRQELWLKEEKRSGAAWMKGRAENFHKSSTTFYRKLFGSQKISRSLQLSLSQWTYLNRNILRKVNEQFVVTMIISLYRI